MKLLTWLEKWEGAYKGAVTRFILVLIIIICLGILGISIIGFGMRFGYISCKSCSCLNSLFNKYSEQCLVWCGLERDNYGYYNYSNDLCGRICQEKYGKNLLNDLWVCRNEKTNLSH